MEDFVKLLGPLQSISGKSDRKSTQKVMFEICKYVRGLNKSFKICLGNSGVPKKYKDEREWLYDLTVKKYTTRDGKEYVAEIYLAVESEWKKDTKHILTDFSKLIQSSSRRKLMIFQANDELAMKEVCQTLLFAVSSFENDALSETYLLACWVNDPNTNGFRFGRIKKDNSWDLTFL